MAVEIANVVHALGVVTLDTTPKFFANFGFRGCVKDDVGQYFLDLDEKLTLTADMADAVIQCTSVSTPAVTYIASILAGGEHKGGIYIQVLKVSDQTPLDGNTVNITILRCPTAA